MQSTVQLHSVLCTVKLGNDNRSTGSQSDEEAHDQPHNLCGGTTALVQAGFETLIEAGYQPEVAYFECLHELKLIVDLMYQEGIAGMRYSISDTAEYGDLTRGPRIVNAETKAEMGRILGEIQDGTFASEWVAEGRGGRENFHSLEEAGKNHPIEKVGAQLRSMMPFINAGTTSVRSTSGGQG